MPTSCPSFPTSPNPKDPVKKKLNFLFIFLTSYSFTNSLYSSGINSLSFFIFYLYAALFQSLLFEACGRTVNPVNGAVGLLWTGNWHVCQAAVETVLRGGTLNPIPELLGLEAPTSTPDDVSEGEVTCKNTRKVRDPNPNLFMSSRSSKAASGGKHKRSEEVAKLQATTDLKLRLTPSVLQNEATYGCRREIRRPGTPSMNSEESVTTTACLESGVNHYAHDGDRKVLNLFV